MKKLFFLAALALTWICSLTPAEALTCHEQCVANRRFCLTHCQGPECYAICWDAFDECDAGC